MNKRVLTSLFCLSAIYLSAQKNSNCHDMDYVVNKTIEALNTRDVNLYLSLTPTDTFMQAVKELIPLDTLARKRYEVLEHNRDTVRKQFEESFNQLLKRIDDQFSTTDWQLKLEKYYIRRTKKDKAVNHSSLVVNITVKGTKQHLRVFATEYHQCFYSFQPVDRHLSSDWYEPDKNKGRE